MPPSGAICSANGPLSRVGPSTRRRRNTLPSFSACTLTAARACSRPPSAHGRTARRESRAARAAAPADGGGRPVVGRASRADRSSTGPVSRTSIGPRARRGGKRTVPCTSLRPSVSRSSRTSEIRPSSHGALPRNVKPSPSAVDPVDAVQPVVLQPHLRRRVARRYRAACASPAVPRSASRRSGRRRRDTLPLPSRCSVSTACRPIGPDSKSVTSSPAAASCFASGRPVTVAALQHLRSAARRGNPSPRPGWLECPPAAPALHRQAVIVRHDIERAASQVASGRPRPPRAAMIDMGGDADGRCRPS